METQEYPLAGLSIKLASPWRLVTLLASENVAEKQLYL